MIVQRDPLMLRFRVPENEAVHLRKDMSVRFTVSERVEPLTAKIAHVAARADATTRMVAVVAEVESPPESLRPGAFAQVSIPVGGPEPTVVLPRPPEVVMALPTPSFERMVLKSTPGREASGCRRARSVRDRQ